MLNARSEKLSGEQKISAEPDKKRNLDKQTR